MKIHILSDLHLESSNGILDNYVVPECDVVILAGDIHNWIHGVAWAEKTFGDKPTIFVAGNHEFWGSRVMSETLEAIKAEAIGTNIHVLENETVVIDGVRFVGTTLWTDFNLHGRGPVDMIIAQQEMGDYNQIKKSKYASLMAEDTLEAHKIARAYLSDELFKEFDGKTVVVTHHAPSELSIVERLKNDVLNPAYASRLENLMLYADPTLWVHGHTHYNHDYMIGETRVVCNPRGYKAIPVKERPGKFISMLNPDFDPGLVIEI